MTYICNRTGAYFLLWGEIITLQFTATLDSYFILRAVSVKLRLKLHPPPPPNQLNSSAREAEGTVCSELHKLLLTSPLHAQLLCGLC